jgi:hypothetical protein
VIEGLKGKPVVATCAEPQISQRQYSQGRDQVLAPAARAFEAQQYTRKDAPLEQENAPLKKLVGELTLELKKSDEPLG